MSVHLPTELSVKMAAAEKKSRQTMLAVIVLAAISFVAIGVLLLVDQAAVAAQVLGFSGATVAALLAYRKSAENGAAIYEVTLNLDGRLQQLLERTDAAARAEGKTAGHAEASAQRQVRSTDIQGG